MSVCDAGAVLQARGDCGGRVEDAAGGPPARSGVGGVCVHARDGVIVCVRVLADIGDALVPQMSCVDVECNDVDVPHVLYMFRN